MVEEMENVGVFQDDGVIMRRMIYCLHNTSINFKKLDEVDQIIISYNPEIGYEEQLSLKKI